MKGWLFVGKTLLDGREVPADGVKLIHDGPSQWPAPILAAYMSPWRAWHFAQGNNMLCHVECSEVRESAYDTIACLELTILSRIDVADLIRNFVRARTEQARKLYPIDEKSFAEFIADDSALHHAFQLSGRAAYVHARAAYEKNGFNEIEDAKYANFYKGGKTGFNNLMYAAFNLPEVIMQIELNDRELAMVLAGLRKMQTGEGNFPQSLIDSIDITVQDVATDGGTFQSLTGDEIDALCERLNIPKAKPAPPQPCAGFPNHRTGSLRNVTRAIVEQCIGFLPNVQDDSQKVTCSWAFTYRGERFAVWDYRGSLEFGRMSTFGPKDLLIEIFGAEHVFD